MKTEAKAVVYECDGCKTQTVMTESEAEVNGPPFGFHGSVAHISEYGGNGGEWFACRVSCIRNAVVTVCGRD